MTLFFLLCIFFTPVSPTETDTTLSDETDRFELTVIAEKIRNDNGHIIIELSDHGGIARAAGKAVIEGDRAELTFKNLTPGEWAVRLFHDENDNEIFDTNFLRIPREGYGFSNNVRGRFGPPPFEDRLFEVRGDTTISVMLIY
ncbi:Uncharacterized conserved protein, DUF2141 family [Cyclonatronum proteinivorum]|uniref:Uncharacterized conserved protein, DUF2141 family n=1 Tax=Cyclonatronum proteinivorum TaxID=1457365 RepID=A0A345UNN2_9BACT|nr:DUF2141 domain-containing protein [Cyclonatronum proteinivorum]AXJ02084.1 Uncharacterized conserved protein, DUF2141 family [Cyclonatronum proteinivorum]